jgi:hypothetical protein
MHAPGCGRAHRIDAWATDPVYYRPGGGESVAQMATRVQNRHAEMAHQNTIESAIVICHAGTRRLLANCQNDLLAMAMQAASKEHLLPTARASSSFAENSPAPAVLACTDTHQPPITAMPLAIPGHGHTESKPYRIQAIPNRSHTIMAAFWCQRACPCAWKLGNTKPEPWPMCAAPATVSKCHFRVTSCLFQPLCDPHGKARQCHLSARIPARTGGGTGRSEVIRCGTPLRYDKVLPVLLFNMTDGDAGCLLMKW